MNDWQSKTILALIPVAGSLGGWVLSIETRLQHVALTQQERSLIIMEMKRDIVANREHIDRVESDPNPRPAAKVMIEQHERRIDRMEQRINSLHEYLIQLPIRPPPFNGKRGDLISPIIK